MRAVLPTTQKELRAIVRRAVGNKVRKLNAHIRQIEAQSHRWKLKYKSLHGQLPCRECNGRGAVLIDNGARSIDCPKCDATGKSKRRTSKPQGKEP